MRKTGFLILLLASTCGVGCASRGDVDLLEAQLRSRENELLQARRELQTTKEELLASRREVTLLQRNLADKTAEAVAPENARLLSRITGIRIEKTLTGGLNRDDSPGDDYLNIVVAPHDAFDAVIRQTGTLEIEVLDLSQPDGRRVVGNWRVEADAADEHWHDGFLGKGFQVELPWQSAPVSETLALHARFVTTDGREFDTTETIQIELGARPAALQQAESPPLAPPAIVPLSYEAPAAKSVAERKRIPLEELVAPR